MKKLYLLAAACLLSPGVFAQDGAEAQKAWEDYMTPGAVHKQLAVDSGTWTEEMTFWMGPGSEPQKSTVTAEVRMILNGLYQESTHRGNVLGMDFEGRNTMAYDNATKELISSWIDNMGSGMIVMKGQYDLATKTVKLSGTSVDPVSKKEKKVREVWTVIDKDTQKMEMFETPFNGKEFKSMEIIMRRKK